MSQALAAFAAFSISALLVFGAVISGGNLKSSPYSARDAAADAKLSDLTDGAGAGILDGLINKLKTSALSKAGTPPKVSLYNAYIDGKLAKIDQLDNEVRNQYGNDYAFIFQYLYPRVLESRLKENATDSIIGQIGTIFSDDSENPPPELVATIPTCPAGYEFSTDHLACVKPTKVALDCKDESRVASWYKGDMARCPDPDGLKFWKDRVAVAGEIPTHSEFAAAVPKGEWYITGTQCSNQKRS